MDASLLGSLELTSGWGVVLSIFVLGGLFILWLWSVFLLVTDSISWFAKIIWFVLLVCLAPLAIPVYLILHHRRTARA
ncbi:MAG TPA: hypothetical protein VLK36_07255 [Gaiellaceae bacterium]|nr:hypothetical protein [Gaiellaceae bacterium]